MKNNILIGKDKWGPVAWNIYHSFSINFIKEYKEDYIIFINTFGYILPCETCKSHYNYIISDIYKIDDIKITKNNLSKYTYKIHKVVNYTLEKKNISYKKSLKINENININNSLFLIKIIYKNLNYNKMSFFLYDKIFNFFITFCKLYPDEKIRNILTKLINTEKFNNINSPNQFLEWFELVFLEKSIIKKTKKLKK